MTLSSVTSVLIPRPCRTGGNQAICRYIYTRTVIPFPLTYLYTEHAAYSTRYYSIKKLVDNFCHTQYPFSYVRARRLSLGLEKH